MAEVLPYSKWDLYRWAALIYERDEFTCVMCDETVFKLQEICKVLDGRWQIDMQGILTGRAPNMVFAGKLRTRKDIYGILRQAHHTEPKFHRPDLARELDNGVCLCHRCHRGVVHATYDTYKKHRHMFAMYNRRKTVRQFNEANQWRVTG